jgi:hypothetical protein
MSTVRKGCINKGEDASDPAVLKEWADRDGIKRATNEVREARAYHEASPAGKPRDDQGEKREPGTNGGARDTRAVKASETSPRGGLGLRSCRPEKASRARC